MVLFCDLKREYAEIGEEILETVRQVLSEGRFILGERVEKFEEEFARYIGTKYATGVNSGSDALYLAVRSLGIGFGDEVITVSHTFVSTVDAISRSGATPIFVDIEPDTYCMDVTQIESRITEKTKALMPVHLYGHPVDMDPVMALAQKHSLWVIEDAAQAHGAEYNGKRVGSIGDVGCFSFYPIKNLGAYGDAGLIVTNRDAVNQELRMLRNYGQRVKYQHDCVGVNSRMDEIHAAILTVKLKYLDVWNDKRRHIAKIYGEALHDFKCAVPSERDYARHVYHLYVIRTEQRQALMHILEKSGIQTQIHYPIPVHRQKAYPPVAARDSLPVTDRLCGEILSLPIHPWLASEEARRVGEVVRNSIR